MTDPTQLDTTDPAAGQPAEATREQMAAWYRDDVAMAAATFLGEVHDVDFHYYSDAGGPFGPEGLDPADVLALTERVETAARRAAADVRAAEARRAWVLSGAPLRCGLCGLDVDQTVEPWRVCAGLAEHEDCHRDDDPAAEAQARAWTRDDDEYQAHLDERTRTGPQPGDRVRLNYGDGSTVEGTWTVDGNTGAAVRRDDGTLHRHVAGQVAREVMELADDASS